MKSRDAGEPPNHLKIPFEWHSVVKQEMKYGIGRIA